MQLLFCCYSITSTAPKEVEQLCILLWNSVIEENTFIWNPREKRFAMLEEKWRMTHVVEYIYIILYYILSLVKKNLAEQHQ